MEVKLGFIGGKKLDAWDTFEKGIPIDQCKTILVDNVIITMKGGFAYFRFGHSRKPALTKLRVYNTILDNEKILQLIN